MAEEGELKKANGVIDNSLVVPLRKTITIGNEEITELRFREPTAADIERCGTPVMFDMFSTTDGSPKMAYDNKAMFAMMSTLAAVPPSTIRAMHAKDWELAAFRIAHVFFLPD